MKTLVKIALAGAVAAGGMAFSATVASADVVCNAENECWHTHGRHYDYHPEFGVTVHPNNWRWGADEHYKWHEHRGRGHWRNGAWIKF